MCVLTCAADGNSDLRTAEDYQKMTTFANAWALLGIFLIRFGGRGGGGFVFMLLGLAVVAVVAYALARPSGSESAKN
jgi:cbb3-type cytochrome oxidase subunit 3